jgi:tetratricopeptide (TPR) repeat protein
VERILKDAAKANPKARAEVALLRAEVLVRQGKEGPAEAEQLLQKACKENKREIDLWTALADLALRRKDFDGANTILREARRAAGDSATLRLGQARLLFARTGKKEEGTGLAEDAKKRIAAAVARLADNTRRFSEDERARLLSGLAEVQFRAGNEVQARRMWEKLAALPHHRNDLRVRLLLFDLAIKDGDEKRMEQTLEDIRNVEQGGVYHRYGHALKLIWRAKKEDVERKKTLQQARMELERVLTQRPSWSPAYLARAQIAELSGNKEAAISDLQAAMKHGDVNLAVVRRLMVLLLEKGRKEEADQVAGHLREWMLANKDLRKIVVDVAFANKDTARALEYARTLLVESTNNPQDLVWQAQVHAMAGKKTEAEAKLRKAIKVAPKDPTPHVALVQFLAQTKKARLAAQKAIERAKEQIPAEQAPLALGRCYEAVGKYDEAQKHYEEALKAASGEVPVVRAVATFYLGTGRLKEAEPLLRRLVNKRLRNISEDDQEWAKRSLASLLASGNDFVRLREALELVGLKLDEEGRLPREDPPEESTETLRVRARVLASQGSRQRQFRLKAIGLLETLASKRALQDDDRYVLALLYQAEGKEKKAHEQLETLAKTKNPQYLAQYAHVLLGQPAPSEDQLLQVGKLLEQLEELEKEREVGPNGFASVDLRARLLEAQGRKDDAIELLQNHVQREGAKPDEVLLVLAALGRQRKFQKALTIGEEEWEKGKVPPEALGGVCVALLRAMKEAKDSQVQRVEKHLKAAIKKNAKSTVLRMHLADLYDKRGRYAEAEVQYRAILKAEPNNVVALNNLAWLLVTWRRSEAEQALTHVNKAIHGMGRRPDLLDTRGLIHLALKQPDKAVADLKEATSDTPTPTRLFHLARAYHEARDRTSATRILGEAKKKGLKPEALHPVEQQACKDLFATYDIR